MPRTTSTDAPAGAHKQVLSMAEVAKQFGVHWRTIRDWTHLPENPLPCVQPGGRRVFFLWDDVVAWLRTQRALRSPTKTPKALRRRPRRETAVSVQ